jgi:hypothetical protein
LPDAMYVLAPTAANAADATMWGDTRRRIISCQAAASAGPPNHSRSGCWLLLLAVPRQD